MAEGGLANLMPQVLPEDTPSADGSEWRSSRATLLISAPACSICEIAGCDFQPNAWRRKRALIVQAWAPAHHVSDFVFMDRAEP